jgi:hypothetical protein
MAWHQVLLPPQYAFLINLCSFASSLKLKKNYHTVCFVFLGLNELVPDSLLSIFDENELEVSG